MNRNCSISLETYDLSIIIPTYFRADDLKLLFRSIMKQTKLPKEIIVVDDTPDDSILLICSSFKDKFDNKKVNLIYKKNKGMRSSARARNRGIMYTSSDLVLFLDSDVFLERKYIEEITNKFVIYKHALGFQGWIVGPYSESYKGIKRLFSYFFNLLFFTGSFVTNRCRLFEYPMILDKTINCEWLSGSNMTVKRSILNEFRFDNNLYKYSFGEDKLLSHSILKKYPNSLYITSDAKLLHFESQQGRMKKDIGFYKMIDPQRKYILYKLFGAKGMLLYYWQQIGLILYRILYLSLITHNHKISIHDNNSNYQR